MTLTKRERIIAIATLSAATLFAVDRFALTPYMAQRQFLSDARGRITRQMNAAGDLFARQRKLRTVWNDMQAGGVALDASSAESQALHALVDWTQSARLNLTAVKPERATQQGQFQIIGFRIVATGPMRSITHLLWSIETATIPVRVTDIQITPRKEGTDDLSVQIGVSTLSQLPADVKSAQGGRS
jgi:hypothetical protein